MKARTFCLTILFATAVVSLVGCGGAQPTVIAPQPGYEETKDPSAEAAEQYPEEYGKMNEVPE